MARAESTMLELGTQAPDFSLTDVITGKPVRREDFAGKALLVMFICAHCPYVKHIEKTLGKLGSDYAGKALAIVAISSNDVAAYPADGPVGMKAQAEANGFSFPCLLDESQEVARAYQAACTPDFFLFDADHKLVYRGQYDASRPGSDIPVTGKDLRAAMEAVVAGKPVAPDQRPSLGCNIKWRS